MMSSPERFRLQWFPDSEGKGEIKQSNRTQFTDEQIEHMHLEALWLFQKTLHRVVTNAFVRNGAQVAADSVILPTSPDEKQFYRAIVGLNSEIATAERAQLGIGMDYFFNGNKISVPWDQ